MGGMIGLPRARQFECADQSVRQGYTPGVTCHVQKTVTFPGFIVLPRGGRRTDGSCDQEEAWAAARSNRRHTTASGWERSTDRCAATTSRFVDGIEHSFAGIQRTYMCSDGVEQASHSVRACAIATSPNCRPQMWGRRKIRYPAGVRSDNLQTRRKAPGLIGPEPSRASSPSHDLPDW